ncbi:major facilitator superfamily domain-containing protein [Gigaspora rosea]|uniref:Major facilitator superfamily domain-containing protein n=1 Tax=Gigaspora rosea TaxID=44941 RepID=A0A397VQN4_9GLOM|nr:major facilitator superfamily domain-containing protein [Gigaspora rosea]
MSFLSVYIPKRIIIFGLCFLGAVISYADRSNMSIAITSMALEFNWSYITEGYILSSFFVGYLTTQIVGGALSDKFGGKWVLGIAGALWTIFTFLTPITAKCGVLYLILCRIFLGIGEGACFPSIHSLISVWFPPEERSRAVGTITSSSFIGTMIAMPVSTLLISSPFGWEGIFFIFGIVGCIWSVTWHFLGASNPVDYPKISKEELSWILKHDYEVDQKHLRFSQFESRVEDIDPEIESSRIIAIEDNENTRLLKASHDQKYLKVGNTSNETLESSNLSKGGIPWKLVFSRREIWAILVTQFCNCFGYYIMLNWLPTYYLDHFGLDINKLGYLAVLPYVSQGIMGLLVGIIGDYLVNKLNVRVITVRRGAQIIGSFGTSIFLLFAAYLATTPIEGILLITIGNSLGAFLFIGVHMSQLDIAPKYAGAIWGLGNTFGVIAGILGVALTGLILDITANNWNFIWNLVVLSSLTGTVLFVLWVGDEVVIS